MTSPEPSREPLDLKRPRDIGALITDGFGTYFRNFGTFIAIAAAVVVPVHLIVCSIGLSQLTSGYDDSPGAAEQLIPTIADLLVAAPLVTAMCIFAMLDLADGNRPRLGSTIQRGLDVFAPLLLVVLMYAAAVAAGLFALIIPGIYLFVRLAFVIQATVVDGLRSTDALRRSWVLVEGSWWRVFGITLVVNFLLAGAASIIALPFTRAAESADSAALQLAGTVVGGLLTVAPAAVISTLLYFDVRARKGD